MNMISKTIITAAINLYPNKEINTNTTWVDGKDIFINVIPFTLPDGAFTVDLSTMNVETVLESKSVLRNDDDYWINEYLNCGQGNITQFYSRKVDDTIEIAYLTTTLSDGNTSFTQIGNLGYCTILYTKKNC